MSIFNIFSKKKGPEEDKQETREVLGSMLDGIYGTIISAIAQGRKKSPADIRTMMDEGPFLGQKALALGLVDGLLYEDQFRDELRKKLGGGEVTTIGAREYAREAGRGKGPRLGLVVAAGSILRGHAGGFGESEVNETDLGMTWMGDPVALDRMPGMATETDLQALAAATGDEANALFVQLMSAHHQGGIHMAEHAATHAATDEVRLMATQMASSQAEEIGEMDRLLALSREG